MSLQDLVRDGETMRQAIIRAISESSHLTPADSAGLQSLLVMADVFDEAARGTLDQKYETARNLQGILIRSLKEMGLTPSGRKDLEPADAGDKDDLDVLRDSSPGLRSVK